MLIRRGTDVVQRSRPGRRGLRLLFLVAAFLAPTRLAAQSHPLNEAWRWVQYDMASGLPSDRVLDVAETTEDVLWASTEGGLAWYDGYRWQPASLAGEAEDEPRISNIVPDLAGQLLVTAGGRLYRGDGRGFTYILGGQVDGVGEVVSVVPASPDTLLVFARGGTYRYVADALEPWPSPQSLLENVQPSLLRPRRTQVGTIWANNAGRTYMWTGGGWSEPFAAPLRFFDEGPWGRIWSVTDPPPGTDLTGVWTEQPGQEAVRAASDDASLITAMVVDSMGDALVRHASGRVRIRTAGQWQWLSQVPEPLATASFVRRRRNGDLMVGTARSLFYFREGPARWSRWADSTLR